jgi:cathepsin B
LKMAKAINSDPEGTWRANEDVSSFSLFQMLEGRLGLQIESSLPENFDQPPVYETSISDLPESLDLREAYPNCEALKEIRDQSACGGCWAFGAVSAMTDRLCIASGQKDQRRISSEDLLECCNACGFGCDGGFLYQSWAYWKNSGLVTGDLYGDAKSCKPYQFPPCNHHSTGPFDDCTKHQYVAPRCKTECYNANYPTPYSQDKIFGVKAYAVEGEHQLIQELNNFGSVEVAFRVYEDFFLYKSGVYKHTTGEFKGAHAVKIIGYGVEDGVKYWIVVNSWNVNWGENGTFKMLRGVNHCGIEASGVAGIPKMAPSVSA